MWNYITYNDYYDIINVYNAVSIMGVAPFRSISGQV